MHYSWSCMFLQKSWIWVLQYFCLSPDPITCASFSVINSLLIFEQTTWKKNAIFNTLFVYNILRIIPAGTVATTCDEINWLPVDVKAPYYTTVAVESAKTFAVQWPPNIWFWIFSGGEEQVTLAVIFDLCDGTLVPLQHKRFLELHE